MSTVMERIEVFKDTLDWIEVDPVLQEKVRRSRETEKVYYENDYPAFDAGKVWDTEISVTRDRSFQAAVRLRKEHPEARIAVLNFANAFCPGGGVQGGANAQEECLCRSSTLYPALNWSYMHNNFYDYHDELDTPLASDTLAYTESIVICKTDEDIPQRLPAEEWTEVDAIIAAAPDLNYKTLPDAALFGYHLKRALHILTVAAARGADILVLGAFGCGAFRNNPVVVADAYRTALSLFLKVFRKVEFAVYCRDEEMRNYHVFCEAFRYLEI